VTRGGQWCRSGVAGLVRPGFAPLAQVMVLNTVTWPPRLSDEADLVELGPDS